MTLGECTCFVYSRSTLTASLLSIVTVKWRDLEDAE